MNPGIIRLPVCISFNSQIAPSEIKGPVYIRLILIVQRKSPYGMKVGVVSIVNNFTAGHHIKSLNDIFIVEIIKFIVARKCEIQLLKKHPASQSGSRAHIIQR